MKALEKQYGPLTILILWALAAGPMGFIRFYLAPLLTQRSGMHPGIMYWMLMVAGMVWLFLLSLIVLKLELGRFRWNEIRQRLWLRTPQNKQGSPAPKLFLLTIPFILYSFFIEQSGLFDGITQWLEHSLPFLAPPEYTRIDSLMDPQFRGDIGLFVLALVSCVFNYLLGEELFFRGILLPKMNGTFGDYDWLLNGVLFAVYHVHKPTDIPLILLGSLFIAYLNKRTKSFWPSVIIHGVEAIPLLLGVGYVIWFL